MVPAAPIWSPMYQYGSDRINTVPIPIRPRPYQYAGRVSIRSGPYQYDRGVSIHLDRTDIICGFQILFIRPLKLGFRRVRLNCASGVLSGGFRHLKTHRYGWKPRKLRKSKCLTRIYMSGCRKRSRTIQKHRFPLGSLLCTSKH